MEDATMRKTNTSASVLLLALVVLGGCAGPEPSFRPADVDGGTTDRRDTDDPGEDDGLEGCRWIRSDGCGDPRPGDFDADGWLDGEDCDDLAHYVYPGAYEVRCNGVDEDCDGHDLCFADADADGWAADLDCDDRDAGRSPGLAEVWCNGIDEDCSGHDPCDHDRDGDSDITDCDDRDPVRYHDAVDAPCDGVDQDCDGSDCCDQDFDGDGYACRTDCNDRAQRVHPGADAPHGCYAEDRNCDGQIDGLDCL